MAAGDSFGAFWAPGRRYRRKWLQEAHLEYSNQNEPLERGKEHLSETPQGKARLSETPQAKDHLSETPWRKVALK